MVAERISPRVRDFLSWQADVYSNHVREEKVLQPGPFVTISREYGCGGVPLGEKIVERLNRLSPQPTPWVVIEKDAVRAIADRRGVAGRFVEALAGSRRGYFQQTMETLFGRLPTEYQAYEALVQSLLSLAEAGRVVMVGRGGAVACAECPRGVHVRVVAPLHWRAERVARERGIPAAEAEAIVVKEELAREGFVRDFTGKDPADPLHYDLIVNLARVTIGQAADLVAELVRARGYA